MRKRNRERTLRSQLAFAVVVLGTVQPVAHAQPGPDAKYVFNGSFYRYGWLGKEDVTHVFGPEYDSYNNTYRFNMDGLTDRYITSMLDLTNSGTVLSIDLFNESYLIARRLEGNNHGGGFTANIVVYVKGPPGTPFCQTITKRLCIRAQGYWRWHDCGPHGWRHGWIDKRND